MGGHKNNAYRGKNGRAVPDSGSMVGEISPDIMFWEIGQKVARVDTHGFRSIWMGAIGSLVTGRSKNKAKRDVIGCVGQIFQCMHTVKKNRKSAWRS